MNVRVALFSSSAVSLAFAITACDPPAPRATSPADAAEVSVPAPSAPTAVPSPTTQAPGTPAKETKAQGTPFVLAATWVSPSCGPRTYERSLRLDGKGRFVALDKVSPCPPNAKCVWSGIVERTGAYATDATSLTLTLDPPKGGAAAGATFPTMFLLAPGPVEKLADGTTCIYQRTNDAL